MKISTRGQYSLEALLFLALLPKDSLASIKTISKNTKISASYLEQLFIPLKEAGIIKGMRGALGGYHIALPLEKLSVEMVLKTVEGTLEPVGCLHSKPCNSKNTCISRQAWESLYNAINETIVNISFEDLVKSFNKKHVEGNNDNYN